MKPDRAGDDLRRKAVVLVADGTFAHPRPVIRQQRDIAAKPVEVEIGVVVAALLRIEERKSSPVGERALPASKLSGVCKQPCSTTASGFLLSRNNHVGSMLRLTPKELSFSSSPSEILN